MSKNVLGYIEFGWEAKFILPLEEAQKIQSILARHAVSVGTAHDKNYSRIEYMVDCDVPAVLVRKELPVMDARGLTKAQIRRWSETIQKGETTEVIDPKTFTAIYGEDNEQANG